MIIMKNYSTLFLLILIFLFQTIIASGGDDNDEIKLIIRGDDIGFSHSANIACIKSYQEGIMTTVEVMVPCPWFPEAVKMLNENPGLDVGIHLVLTSEWENMKWRPLTDAPSIVDENGYFYPMIWQRDDFPPNSFLRNSDWKIEEIEKELRAQIELATKNIPHISHLTGHMGCGNWDEKVQEVFNKLAKEYELEINPSEYGVEYSGGLENADTPEKKVVQFTKLLERLGAGTWMFVEHPGINTPELQAIGHTGYENVAIDRVGVTNMFTNERVKKVIKDRNIKLINYKDLVNN